jgi:type IV pilus assembly protein PilC
MAAVFVVLIGYVLPIFNEAFTQAGVELSQTALLLMALGQWLSSAGAALLAGLAVLAGAVALLYRLPGTAQATKRRLIRALAGAQIARGIAGARFSMALSMAVSAGIDTPGALALAKDVAGDQRLTERAERFEQALEQGESFEESLKSSRLFSERDSRLLALGMKTGRFDEQMSEIAEKSEARVLDALDDRLRKVEPALVIILSFLVGIILFSVMLPLMGIMSALG